MTAADRPSPTATGHTDAMVGKEIGVQRIAATGGFCWLCGFPAVAGEKLPGRRHRVRLLCRRHDHLIFGTP
jgi:hypothetical protein